MKKLILILTSIFLSSCSSLQCEKDKNGNCVKNEVLLDQGKN